jgi:DNA-binding CsgD family transcriptional regulator
MRTKATLTAREVTILELLAGGITTSAAISQQLGVSRRFVNDSVSRLIGKFGVKNRTELAVKWWVRKQGR